MLPPSFRATVARGLPLWVGVLAAAVSLSGASASGQANAVPNSEPNPYELVLDWARLPPDNEWGQVIAFDFDADGNVYVFHRNDPGILKFSPDGQLLDSWGDGLFVMAHGLTVDRFGYIWTADSDARDGRGGQVLKFDLDGTLLMSLGTAGVLAEGPDTFVAPTWVVVAESGDIFVSDGHGRPAEGMNHRILKFAPDGTLLKTWGRTGAAPGEFNDPHGLALDSEGRLFVADRGNRRIQIFDQEGTFLEAWTQFSIPENIFITGDDTLYVSDSNSRPETSPYERGIRVGSARDGIVRYFIPEESWDPMLMGTTGPVGLAVDAKGDIFAADVGTAVGFEKMVKKYIRR